MTLGERTTGADLEGVTGDLKTIGEALSRLKQIDFKQLPAKDLACIAPALFQTK